MSRVFVSYRRDETSGHAGRLIDRLNERYGEDRVFFDLQTLEPGVDWVEALEEALDECQVLIAIIGRVWLTSEDKKGRRRLDDPMDSLRREVATALARNVRVVPVLVQEAKMPDSPDLPDELAPLARRHAIELTDSRWDYDVGRLIQTLDRVLGEEEPSTEAAVRESEKVPEDAWQKPTAPGAGPKPSRQPGLSQLLPGIWQVQIAHPMGAVGTLNVQFDNFGQFQGQKFVPGMGVSSVQGYWQILPGDQMALQGQETLGFQVGPYAVVVQFQEVTPNRLSGVTNAGEQVVCVRTG